MRKIEKTVKKIETLLEKKVPYNGQELATMIFESVNSGNTTYQQWQEIMLESGFKAKRGEI